KVSLLLSPTLESLKGCCAGEALQPEGVLRCNSPSTAFRSDVTSTSTFLLVPGLNKAAAKPKLSATGATTASLRGLPPSAVEIGSSVKTRVCPPTWKTNSTGK